MTLRKGRRSDDGVAMGLWHVVLMFFFGRFLREQSEALCEEQNVANSIAADQEGGDGGNHDTVGGSKSNAVVSKHEFLKKCLMKKIRAKSTIFLYRDGRILF